MLVDAKQVVDDLRESLESDIDAKALERSITLTLGDLVREGSTVTTQCSGFGTGDKACALSAAAVALAARGYTKG